MLPPASVLGANSLRTVAERLLELVESEGSDDSRAVADRQYELREERTVGTKRGESTKRITSAQSSDYPQRISLSAAQEGVWFVEKLLGPSGLYNLVQAVRLTGALDALALQRSVQALVDRHASLRTSFEECDGIPVQVVHATVPLSLSILDLSQNGSQEQA